MDARSLSGIVCPMLTAFDGKGKLSESGMAALADFLLERGVGALFPGGTNGEGMLLTLEERKQLCRIIVRHVGRRAPVIMHTGCVSTEETIELTRHAQDTGATAAAMIVPYYFTFDDRSLSQHFLKVAHAVPDFPLFVYCFPGAAKNDVSPRLLATLHEQAPNIIGAKITNPDIGRFQEYVAASDNAFLLFNGVDGLALPALAVGSRGQVSGNANAFPEVLSDLYRAYVAGDMVTAQKKQRLLNRIRYALADGVHPAYLKAALRIRGIDLGTVRSPMRELSGDELASLAENMPSLLQET